jgi:hypothetical protein
MSKLSQTLAVTNLGLFFGLLLYGLLAQLARAPALQAGGQGFDSLTVHRRGSLQGVLFVRMKTQQGVVTKKNETISKSTYAENVTNVGVA